MRRAALVFEAVLALALYDAERLAGFARVYAWLRAQPVTARRSTGASISDVVWAVDEACVWYVRRVACLQRSLVARSLLRQRGHAAALVIGYRALPFESHAWVEVDGIVVNDRPEYQAHFSVLERV
jgi:hypothetical protein